MPRVAILTGSKSDLPVLEPCVETLTDLGIDYELHVMSAHRSPAKVQQFAASAAGNGFEVIIAAAGMAAHLPGVVASMTTLPVIGVPISSGSHAASGLDALLSIAQIPTGRLNEIVIDFADPGAIKLYFLTKVPGAQLSLGNAEMAFHYKDSFAASHMLEGYEHLILMAMVGDQSLFTRSDGIERLWNISEPLLENPPPVEPYPVGSYGPESMKRLIAPYHWHLPHV